MAISGSNVQTAYLGMCLMLVDIMHIRGMASHARHLVGYVRSFNVLNVGGSQYLYKCHTLVVRIEMCLKRVKPKCYC